jgi:glycosyltransferase 2 family protein
LPDPSSRERSIVARLKRRFILGLIFGIAVVTAVVAVGNGPVLVRTLTRFDWLLMPLIIGLTLFNYLLRFFKWQLYLRWLNISGIPIRVSLGIFLAGFSMAITPGKVGEFLKAYLLRRATRAPVATTAPIVIVERLTDGVAMLGLAAVGLITVRYGWQVLAAVAAMTMVGILVLRRRDLVLGILSRLEHLPLIADRAHALRAFYESTYVLLKPMHLLAAIAIGFVSWAGECIAFFLILGGLGLPLSLPLLATATFILATATILGSLSMLPGGLGVAEAGVAGLLLLLVQDLRMTADVAATATLLVRFVTLWFGVLLGMVGLLVTERYLQRLETQPASLDLAPSID